MIRDDLSGILPGRRFITIHPELLNIMGYHEAALLHEIRWRSLEADDGWVRLLPDEWEDVLHLTTKQVRRAQDLCIDAGWIEAERRGDSWDRCRSFRLVVGAIRIALEGDSIRPGGRLTTALEGDSYEEEELSQEGLSVSSSVLTSNAIEDHPDRLTVEDSTTLDPPIADDPPADDPSTRSTAMMPDWARKGLGIVEAAYAPPATAEQLAKVADVMPHASPLPALSTSQAPERHRAIKTARVLQRALQPHGVVASSSQRDQRDFAKLLELRPTFAQIDGACNALAGSEGSISIGRLVSRWATLSQFADPRPAAWENKRTKERDANQRHLDGGGDPYGYDGKADYGI